MIVPLAQRRRLPVPECVQNLDLELVKQVLTKHEGHTYNAAIELGVPPSALTKLTWARPELLDVAFEVHERFLDDCEAVLRKVVRGSNEDRALRAAGFGLSHLRGARARGYVPASGSIDDEGYGGEPAQSVTYNVRWGGPSQPTETIERDGKLIEVPIYDRGPDEPVAEPLRLDAPAANAEHRHKPLVGGDLQGAEQHLGDGDHADLDALNDLDDTLRPLTGEARDRVEAALKHRPGDRDVILSTVEANGFDISGL
jgi:hypothetical protein